MFKQKIPKSFFVNINLIYYSKLKNKQRANDKNDYKDIVRNKEMYEDYYDDFMDDDFLF